VTDAELDTAITEALSRRRGEGLPSLIALRDRLQAERDPLDPGIARTWDALVRVAARSPDDLDPLLELSEGRARWLTAVRGPTHPDVIQAWRTLGDIADTECAWDIATRAWEAIAHAPIDGASDATLLSISLALRGLSGRKLAADQLDEVRVLNERDLVINERVFPAGDRQVALCLENLAGVTEQLGDRAAARAYRQRQRDMLVKVGGSASQLAKVDAQLAKLA